jgi:hypothetical protein
MTDEAYQELNTTKKVIRDSIQVKKATWSALSGVTSRTGKPLALSKFTGARQTAKGVSVKVLRSGPRTILKHAFLATMKSGHVGVFWREEKVGTGKKLWPATSRGWFGTLPRDPDDPLGQLRLHLEHKTGPRVEDILADAGRWKNVEDKANARLIKNMDQEVTYELSRL